MNLFRNQPRIFWLSLLINIVFLLLRIFLSSPIFQIFILVPWLSLPLLPIYFFIFIWSSWYFVKFEKPCSVLPLCINLIFALIIILVPFDQINIQVKFQMNFKDMEQVVQLIKLGRLTGSYSSSSRNNHQISLNRDEIKASISLPLKYEHLSLAGEVGQEGGNLFFIVNKEGGFHGDTYQGFVYQNNLETPQQCPGIQSTEIHDRQTFKKLQDHWFWGECYRDDG